MAVRAGRRRRGLCRAAAARLRSPRRVVPPSSRPEREPVRARSSRRSQHPRLHRTERRRRGSVASAALATRPAAARATPRGAGTRQRGRASLEAVLLLPLAWSASHSWRSASPVGDRRQPVVPRRGRPAGPSVRCPRPSPPRKERLPEPSTTAHSRRRRMAVREWPAASRARRRLRRSVGHHRPVSPAAGRRRPDGQRHRRARHAGHGRGRREGLSPRETADRYSSLIREDLRDLGLSYDLFTRTTTQNHYRVVQDLFRTLLRARLHRRADDRWARSRPPPATRSPTATSRARARSAGSSTPAATSATTAGTSSIPIDLIDPRSKIDGDASGLQGDERTSSSTCRRSRNS